MAMPADGRSPPPWEVLLLVSSRLDPQTLAVSSCVCKEWSHSMSIDSLWKPPCASHFPSLCLLRSASSAAAGVQEDPAAVSFRRLYALGQRASLRRRSPPLPKPVLSLADVAFLVDVRSTKHDLDIATVFAPADEFCRKSEIFLFDLRAVDGERQLPPEEELEGVRVTWSVVLKTWEGMFMMLSCSETEARSEPSGDKWFTQELPQPGCCSGHCSGSLAAEVKLGMGGRSSGEMRVEGVSVGVMSMAEWRYLSIDDGLRYLQSFLFMKDMK
ncbi:hypothetical protein MLD38_020125 [Melastoma candidum]|uniref:Uncharacterized protein n=1 Tax=Melastoma candidum TaxID=119954 RepID=A0ACB9QC83_9MYRT|nr:hypothetical protein MLD38_020125 [Melastoma candidum]